MGGAGDTLAELAAGAEGAVPTRQADGTIAEVVPSAPSGGGGRTLIATHTVPSGGEASHSFADIPGTYGYLELEAHGRFAGANGYCKVASVQFNGDTGANYSHAVAGAAGYQVAWAAAHAASLGTFAALPGTQATAGTVGWARLTIPHYAGTNWRKPAFSTFVLFEDGAAGEQGGGQGLVNWRSTAAITRVDVLAPASFPFAEGTVLSLYGRD